MPKLRCRCSFSFAVFEARCAANRLALFVFASMLFEGRKAVLSSKIQLALSVVRRRFEREIDAKDAKKILNHLAKQLASGNISDD